MIYEDRVSDHYTHGSLVDTIYAALRDAGKDIDNLTPADLAPIDHFHGRGVEATKEIADRLAGALDLGPDRHLVDLGCGLGGPARYIAARFGCRVTGIDLTPEFCAVARQLTEATGLSDWVVVRHGSVLDLPFADQTFDGAYSQNVSMNIADKGRFYAEACRILEPGGAFVLSEYCVGPGGDVLYPVPWAETAATSHLTTVDAATTLLAEAGFEAIAVEDGAERMLRFYASQRERVARHGPPRLGIHLILGDRFKAMTRNSARNVEERRVVPIEILCRKP